MAAFYSEREIGVRILAPAGAMAPRRSSGRAQGVSRSMPAELFFAGAR
jgi:hypothetical protein